MEVGNEQAAAAGVVLTTLCAGQFLMTLDSSVMNVSIATVAKLAGERLARGGAPFVADADLEKALDDAGVPGPTADAIVSENADARIDALRASLAVLAAFALAAQYATRKIPRTRAPADAPASA